MLCRLSRWQKAKLPVATKKPTDKGIVRMTKMMEMFVRTTQAGLLALLVVLLPITAQAAHHEEEEGTIRAVAVSMEAEVVAIDLETREVSLKRPDGDIVTLHSPEKVVKLEDISVGDRVVTTYIAALEGEVREPTAEELAEPWLVIEEAGVSKDGQPAAIGAARIIRAVCTIEGMNRELGVVTIKDPRGKLHLIGDVEPEKMEGVTLGQTIVMVYSEAMALTLEKKVAVAQ
jgi:hypothetical protein